MTRAVTILPPPSSPPVPPPKLPEWRIDRRLNHVIGTRETVRPPRKAKR